MNIQDFNPRSTYEQTQGLANLLPVGEVWKAKNIQDSVLRRFLASLSKEVNRAEGAAYGEARSFIPNEDTTDVVPWESFVGIPTGCFDTNYSEKERRINVIIKLGYLNLQTLQDYYDLADKLGVVINTVDVTSTPGTIIISVVDLNPDNVFNLYFDSANDPVDGAFVFGSRTGQLYECLVRNYKSVFFDVLFTN